MFSQLIDYTVSSSDPNNYNKIFCNLTAPPTKYSILTITCLTTNCNIEVLNNDDNIIIDNHKYQINDSYTNINLEAFVELLHDYPLNDVNMYIDNIGRMCFHSERSFVINDMSYNVILISGMYHKRFNSTLNIQQ